MGFFVSFTNSLPRPGRGRDGVGVKRFGKPGSPLEVKPSKFILEEEKV